MHLTGLARVGFVWRAREESLVEVWYWDEDRPFDQPSGSRNWAAAGLAPYPEPLLRPESDGDGLRLFRCAEGVEAVAVVGGAVKKTRWLPNPPSESEWVAFVRDAGFDPAAHPMPSLVVPAPQVLRVQPGWTLHTTGSGRLSAAVLAAVLGVALVGGALAGVLAYDLKLSSAIREVRSQYRQTAAENATMLDLNRQLQTHAEYISSVAKARAEVSQLDLMQKLAQVGVFDEATKISLMEWEYRNARLRLLFSVPQEGFSLSLFLSMLEKQGFLRNLRLVPDTPPLTVGIQADLAVSEGAAAQPGPDVR